MQRRSGKVAEGGALPTSEHSRHPCSFATQRWMTNGVDTRIDSMEIPMRKPMARGLPIHSDVAQLLGTNSAVLERSDLCNSTINGTQVTVPGI
jgi:hypothetical protein